MIINAKLQVLFMIAIAYIHCKYIFIIVQVFFSEDPIKLESVSEKGHHILCVSNAITSRYNGHII